MENKNEELEKTLVIIKPDGMKHFESIVKIIVEEGYGIEYCEMRKLTKDIVREHYSHLLDKDFYPRLEKFMLSDTVAIMVVNGENAISGIRDLIGPTDSAEAPIWTIRGKFGTDKTVNAVHASDSIDSAQQEIKRFVKKR